MPVYSDTTQLNSRSSWVELCRCKRALRCVNKTCSRTELVKVCDCLYVCIYVLSILLFRQPHQSCLDLPPHPLVNPSVIIPAVIHHSFTLSLQAQNLPFQQILPTLDFFYLLDCLMIMTYHAHHFIFSFTFYFFVYSVWYPLATRQLFTAR